MVEMPYGPQVLWPDHCTIGPDGAAFHPRLKNEKADLVIGSRIRRAEPGALNFVQRFGNGLACRLMAALAAVLQGGREETGAVDLLTVPSVRRATR